MNIIKARVTRNIKEEPSNEHYDIWNIEATLLDKCPENATQLLADSTEIEALQVEATRLDTTRTAVTIRTRQKSGLNPGDVIHLRTN
jgi:hypothetical protein